MAKFIRSTNLAAALLLVLIVCSVLDVALAQNGGLRQFCDRLSKTIKGDCTDHKACRNSCFDEQGPVLGGGCIQTSLSFDQTSFTDCLNEGQSVELCGQNARRDTMNRCVCFVAC